MTEIQIKDTRKKGFFITDNEAVDEMIQIIGHSAFAVYCVISRHSDKNGEAFPSQETIAKKAGLHRETVIEKIKILEEANMIKVDQTKETGTGKWLHNTYTLLDRAVWIKSRHGKIPTRVEAESVSVNSDTNNTHVLTTPIEKNGKYQTPIRKEDRVQKIGGYYQRPQSTRPLKENSFKKRGGVANGENII